MKHSKKPSALNLTPNNHSGKHQRNSFDLSYHSYFTSPTGLLLPNFVQDVQPGDYMKLDVSHFSRTMPVNTAAYSRFKEITDFYFVPYRLLWRWFDQFYSGVNDVQTAYNPLGMTATEDVPSKVPYIKAATLQSALATATTDVHGLPVSPFVERLLDMLGYPVSNKSDTTSGFYTKLAALATPPTFNAFRILCYQKLYFEYYRNSDYDVNEPTAYNIDNLGNNAEITLNMKMFTPRYALWKKDRFTSVKPTPLFNTSAPNSSIVPINTEGIVDPNYIARSVGENKLISGVDVANSVSYTNVSQLRATLAYDRLSRLSMLSKKTYDAQIKAHFGVQPDSCDYCRPRFLGTFDSSLNIGEVTATASGTAGASSNVLGQIAGKGICAGSTNKPISAEFTEPGIVMGMHYFLPFSEYDSNRVDDFNTKFGRNDYFIPEYDNLGMSYIKAGNINIDVTTPTNWSLNSVAGYQARYLEYKTRVDEVHGLFQSGKSLSTWASPRTQVIPSGIISAASLKVNPKVSDTLFTLKYDGTQSTDPFLCHFKFKCTLVRNMSLLGLATI